VDQDALFQHFLKNAKWKDTLDKKLAYKSLDIAEENDMQISNTNGMGWKEMAVIAGALLGGAWLYTNQPTDAPVAPLPAVVAPIAPVGSDYELRFYDAAGNLIDLPHISER
jgi:hypothetical protein